MFRPLLAIPLAASLLLAGCGKSAPPTVTVTNPTTGFDIGKIDFAAIVQRASDASVLACHYRPARDTIGPILASAISTLLGFGPAPGFTVDAAIGAAVKTFCDAIQNSQAAGAAPTVGRARGAAINFGTVDIGGRPVPIIGTPE
jgi:hypothetical protein